MISDMTTINNSGLLKTENINALQSVASDIDAGFKRRQRFRPKFLMETSVLNDMKHPTPDSKYWQCTVERDVHFKNLVMLSFDYREKCVDIRKLESQFDPDHGNLLLDKFAKEKIGIQIEREKILLVYMKKEGEERVREIMAWSEIMTELEPQLKYDPADIEAHMPEAYAIRFAREMQVLEKVRGQSDMSGAMNIISVGQSVGQHQAVQKLVKGGD